MRDGGRERGQASIEALLVLPLVAVLLAAGWQAVVVGQTRSLAGTAARAAARASAIGADPARAARAALPAGAWRRAVVVRRLDDGRLRVLLAVPALAGRWSPGQARLTVRPGDGA